MEKSNGNSVLRQTQERTRENRDEIREDKRKKMRIRKMWYNMKARCYSKAYHSYHRYGGRGITVCPAWLEKYENFEGWVLSRDDYEKGKQLERIDNSKGYSPDNCEFKTPSENCRNRSNNIKITVNGREMLLIEASEEFDISYDVLFYRIIKSKMTVMEAINTPVQEKKSVMYKGKKYTYKELGKISNIKTTTIWTRLNVLNWPIEKAIGVSIGS